MQTVQWFIGPQLIGIVYLLMGLILQRFPPKKINNYYGYRLPSAMKDQATWDEANRYSAAYMVKAGLVLLIGGLAASPLLHLIPSQKMEMAIWFLLILLAGMGGAVMMIIATERHLGKVFDDKNK